MWYLETLRYLDCRNNSLYLELSRFTNECMGLFIRVHSTKWILLCNMNQVMVDLNEWRLHGYRMVADMLFIAIFDL